MCLCVRAYVRVCMCMFFCMCMHSRVYEYACFGFVCVWLKNTHSIQLIRRHLSQLQLPGSIHVRRRWSMWPFMDLNCMCKLICCPSNVLSNCAAFIWITYPYGWLRHFEKTRSCPYFYKHGCFGFEMLYTQSCCPTLHSTQNAQILESNPIISILRNSFRNAVLLNIRKLFGQCVIVFQTIAGLYKTKCV